MIIHGAGGAVLDFDAVDDVDHTAIGNDVGQPSVSTLPIINILQILP